MQIMLPATRALVTKANGAASDAASETVASMRQAIEAQVAALDRIVSASRARLAKIEDGDTVDAEAAGAELSDSADEVEAVAQSMRDAIDTQLAAIRRSAQN